METIRLQKYLSDCGVLSRRAAEKSITDGEITVNGNPAEIGMKIDPQNDDVRWKGKKIVKKRGTHYVYVLLNKPTGYVTTLSDEKGRPTVSELVKDVGVRVYPVGRLDMNSEGFLLLTNDGEFTNAMTHPSHGIPKYYEVRVKENVTPEILQKLSSAMEIDGYRIRPVECRILEKTQNYTLLGMILYEGRNRQIRKMCEICELTVSKLTRVGMGDLTLDVPRGKWRYLDKDEIDYLKNACRLCRPGKQKGQ